MACKLTCPKCGNVLKEEGDELKQAEGDYRVYDSLGNSDSKAGSHRLILCLVCSNAGKVADFDDDISLSARYEKWLSNFEKTFDRFGKAVEQQIDQIELSLERKGV